jgi:hypothetical protein
MIRELPASDRLVAWNSGYAELCSISETPLTLGLSFAVHGPGFAQRRGVGVGVRRDRVRGYRSADEDQPEH